MLLPSTSFSLFKELTALLLKAPLIVLQSPFWMENRLVEEIIPRDMDGNFARILIGIFWSWCLMSFPKPFFPFWCIHRAPVRVAKANFLGIYNDSTPPQDSWVQKPSSSCCLAHDKRKCLNPNGDSTICLQLLLNWIIQTLMTPSSFGGKDKWWRRCNSSSGVNASLCVLGDQFRHGSDLKSWFCSWNRPLFLSSPTDSTTVLFQKLMEVVPQET